MYVALLAVGNGSGRIVAGMVSDYIGRKATLGLFLLAQAAALGALSQVLDVAWLNTAPVLGSLSVVIGASYGANLALFPSITKDFYGLKHFGTNYGLVFTAWGAGGFVLSQVAGRVFDATQSFVFAYYTSAGLLLVAAVATLLIVPPRSAAD
jgi:OFA family oxalate/formate antiporter-like MFS transporter